MQGGALRQVRGPDPAIRSYTYREGLEPLGDAIKATDATQMGRKVPLLCPALPQSTLSCIETWTKRPGGVGMGDEFSRPELRRGGQEVDKQTDALMTEPLLWTHSSRPSGHHVASSHDQRNLRYAPGTWHSGWCRQVLKERMPRSAK